jgi:Endonuclease-reverse transcriptase
MSWSRQALLDFFPMHTVMLQQSPSHVRGTGVALLVHRKWSQSCTHISGCNPLMQLVAVKLQPPAVPHNLIIANCYVPPVGSPQFHNMSMLDCYQHLAMFCGQALGSAHNIALLLVGDFNAAVAFGASRLKGSNESGRLLVNLASDCDMSFALQYTATTPPSYFTHRDGKVVTSCPDHVLVSEGLAGHTCATVRRDVLGSDHRAIDVRVKWPSSHPSFDQPIPLHPHFPVLRWKGNTRTYAQELHHRIRHDCNACCPGQWCH